MWRFSDNVTKDYVLHVGQVDAAGQVREVKLVIGVSNSDEEAHEAMVTIVMPPAFEYLGTDERVCSTSLRPTRTSCNAWRFSVSVCVFVCLFVCLSVSNFT